MRARSCCWLGKGGGRWRAGGLSSLARLPPVVGRSSTAWASCNASQNCRPSVRSSLWAQKLPGVKTFQSDDSAGAGGVWACNACPHGSRLVSGRHRSWISGSQDAGLSWALIGAWPAKGPRSGSRVASLARGICRGSSYRMQTGRKTCPRAGKRGRKTHAFPPPPIARWRVLCPQESSCVRSGSQSRGPSRHSVYIFVIGIIGQHAAQ